MQPELSKEIRSLGVANRIFDAYLPTVKNSYPARINMNDADYYLSLFLSPKSGYLDNIQSNNYNIELLCGEFNSNDNINDIFITKEYADTLLNNDKNNYNDLIGKLINIPYKISTKDDETPFFYKIKGVIDTSSQSYKYYREILGDFFIVNQYLTLPLPWGTCVLAKSSYGDLYQQIRTINKIYKYEANIKNIDSLHSTYPYEYRITWINNGVTYEGQEISDFYAFFNSKQNIPCCIISLSISVVALILFSSNKIKNNKIPTCTFPLTNLVINLLILSISVVLNYVTFTFILRTLNLASSGWLPFLINLLLIIVCLVCDLKAKKINDLDIKSKAKT